MFIVISFPFILGGYTPLTLGSGAIYGVIEVHYFHCRVSDLFTKGTITVSIGSTTGACVAFWLFRHCSRNYLQKKFANRSEFSSLFKLSKMKGDNHKLVTFLARLSPIPFGIFHLFHHHSLINIHFFHLDLCYVVEDISEVNVSIVINFTCGTTISTAHPFIHYFCDK
jgi:hypothetical protein